MRSGHLPRRKGSTRPAIGRRRRAAALLLAAAGLPVPVEGVLRYPDGSFEARYPLHVDECALPGRRLEPSGRGCLLRLRQHLLEDADCNRVICDNIHTSTPVEIYANQTDWAPFKNLCGHMQELFLGVFDLGVDLLGRASSQDDELRLRRLWEVFLSAEGLAPEDTDGAPAYANTTRAVIRHHGRIAALQQEQCQAAGAPDAETLLRVAVALARRLQLLIENVSVTLLLNFHVAQLEHQGRLVHGHDYVSELYGDVDSINVVFHEIPGKRWDSLTHLLEKLGVASGPVAMAEIGVEAANTSQRLLERNPSLTYIGIDPYIRNDGLYHHVAERLAGFIETGRFRLLRSTSLDAAELVDPQSLDLVFLDARHDYEAVTLDIEAWRPKVRPGGILSGHDFSWMFPTTAMAVYKAAFGSPERLINLAPDGVWWFQL